MKRRQTRPGWSLAWHSGPEEKGVTVHGRGKFFHVSASPVAGVDTLRGGFVGGGLRAALRVLSVIQVADSATCFQFAADHGHGGKASPAGSAAAGGAQPARDYADGAPQKARHSRLLGRAGPAWE